MIIPKHLFADYIGAKSRDAPTNLSRSAQVPTSSSNFKPGDLVPGEINTNYHMPNRPYFDTIEMKGGGDAVSAARAVLQTGEYDFAWNMQVEDEILKRLEKGGKGNVVITAAATSSISSSTSPTPGPRSMASAPASRRSIRCFPTRRCARRWRCWSTGIDREIHLRPTGAHTRQLHQQPERFRSKNTTYEFSIDKANELLEEGRLEAGRGRRPREGRQGLKMVYQTSINAPRQKTQEIVKQACQKAGIEVEIKIGRGLGVLLLRRRQSRTPIRSSTPTSRCTRLR